MRVFRFSLFVLLSAMVLMQPLTPWAEETAPEAKVFACSPLFQDNAVLQRDIPLPVWGIAPLGASVHVDFQAQRKTAKANEDGEWRVVLDPLKAVKLKSAGERPEGHEMRIIYTLGDRGNALVLRNLVIGDVWYCAGQSNMAGKMKTNATRHFPADSIAKADYPGMRFSLSTQESPWLVCSPSTAPEIKKVAFFFGRRVYEEALIPVGLVVSAVGGSNIESWLNQAPYETGKNYSKLVAPVAGFGIRGLVWYQGESNAKKGSGYGELLTSLITGWRKAWGQGDFPVHYVQLPGYGAPSNDPIEGGDGWCDLQQQQQATLSVKNTGMAITIDIGDKSVHPPNKYDTGVRLAHLALHHQYGMKDVVPSGPLYKSHAIKGGSVRVSFEYAEGGLMLAQKEGFLPPVPTPEASLECLAIQDAEGKWHRAKGKIDGDQLLISSEDVAGPVAVRYAFHKRPAGSLLYNKAGLPMAPFSIVVADSP